MNARPVFIPSLSRWKVAAYKGHHNSWFFQRIDTWEDCKEMVSIEVESPSPLITEPVKLYIDKQDQLKTFASYSEALAWMKTSGLVLCDDLGHPIEKSNTPGLDQTFSHEKK